MKSPTLQPAVHLTPNCNRGRKGPDDLHVGTATRSSGFYIPLFRDMIVISSKDSLIAAMNMPATLVVCSGTAEVWR